MADKSEYEVDLKVNKFKLDEEWEDQPLLYMKWAERVAEAKSDTFRAEEKLKQTKAQMKFEIEKCKAELDDEIRNEWDLFGFDKKPTEAAIVSCILTQEKYHTKMKEQNKKLSDAINEVAEAIKTSETLEGARLAMSHKRSAIEGEVFLWAGNYFSDARIPQIAKEAVGREITETLRRRLPRRKQ